MKSFEFQLDVSIKQMGVLSNGLLACMLVTKVASATKPNIMFIVIDDLGFDDVGFRSHEIKVSRLCMCLPCIQYIVR